MERDGYSRQISGPHVDRDDMIEVVAPSLQVYDQPKATSYLTDSLRQGDRVKVRDQIAGGWLAIDPPSSGIYWIEEASLDFGSDKVRAGSHFADPAGSSSSASEGDALPTRAWVVASRAPIRAGHPSARLPGPPGGSLPKGTMVRLVDRPPIRVGRGKSGTLWYAIVPPPGVLRYVRAEGTRLVSAPRVAASHETQPSERLASYEVSAGQDDRPASAAEKPKPAIERPSSLPQGAPESHVENLPPDVASEIASVEAMHRGILADQPIEQWRFDTVRARYQAILKRAGSNPAVEEAIRVRLARVTRNEQAAQATRTIRSILARSHRLDGEVAEAKRRLAAAGKPRWRAYTAVGLIKPSARLVDGRPLFSLIGTDGSTTAYLDVPAGLDVEALVTRRVGVRGTSHYNEDLGARLITVRDIEAVETRR
jgi:hypothetical protein